MYIVASAGKNLRRYWGRYLLFGALLIAVLAVSAVALSARLAVQEKNEALLREYGAEPSVAYDGRPLTREAAEPLLAFDEVEAIHHTRYAFYFPMKAIRINGNNLPRMVDKDGIETLPRWLTAPDERRKGMELCALGIDFALDEKVNAATAEHQVVLGRFPAAPDEVAINHTFDEYLLLRAKPGDTLELTLGDRTSTYTIVGLFGGIVNTKPATTPLLFTIEGAEALRNDGTLDDYYFSLTDEANAVAIQQGKETLATLESLSVDNCTTYTTYVALRSHTLYDDFTAALDALNAETGGRYTARLTHDAANELVRVYSDAQRLTAAAIAAVLLLAAVVILIMTALGMHERKYEIGVLLAVGMTRRRVVLLFALENLLFALIVTAVAYAVGLAAAPPLADRFLDGAVTVSRTSAALPVAAALAALALGLSLTATAVSSLAILRYRPADILRSRT